MQIKFGLILYLYGLDLTFFYYSADDNREEAEKLREEEDRILQSVTQTALITASEIAQGVKYMESIKTSWNPPKHIRHQSTSDAEQLRRKKGISIEGESVPHPIGSFCVRILLLLCIKREYLI